MTVREEQPSGDGVRHQGVKLSSVGGALQPLSDRFFVTGQIRFKLHARLPVFSAPGHRPLRADFHFHVHSLPMPFQLETPADRGNDSRPGDACSHVFRQELDRSYERFFRHRLRAVRVPTSGKLQ